MFWRTKKHSHAVVLKLFFCLCLFSFSHGLWADSEAFKEHYERALEWVKKDEIDKAIESFQSALKFDPDSAEIYNLLGILYLQKKKSYESAIGSFLEAVRINPNYEEAYFNLAVTYAEIGKEPEMTAQYLRKVIDINPNYAKAYLGLGIIYLNQSTQEPEKALELLQKAVELDPNQPEAQYGLALAYIGTGKRAKALTPLSVLRSMNRPDLVMYLEAYMQGLILANPEKKSEGRVEPPPAVYPPAEAPVAKKTPSVPG